MDEGIEKKIRAMLKHCPVKIVVVDAEGRLLEDWSGSQEWFGFQPGELEGKSLFEHIPAEQVDLLRAALTEVAASPGASSNFESRMRARDGEWRWVSGTVTNLGDDHNGRLLVYWQDVTERKQAQESAAAGEALLGSIFEGAPVGMLMSGMDRVIRRANPKIHEILGYGAGELVGANVHSLIHPDDMERLEREAAPARAGQFPMLRTEVRLLRKDGGTVWVDVGAFYMRDGAGRPVAVVGILLDVTERKQVMAELEEANQRIHKFAEYAVEARKNERLAVARSIHDELGQMLTGILMELRLLRTGPVNEYGCSEELAERVRIISDHIRNGIRFVQRLSVELRPNALDQMGLCHAIRLQIERFQENTGISCKLLLPAEEPEMSPAQSRELFRIFQELLTNIARHSRANAVLIRLRERKDKAILTVRDNGIGFQNELVKTIRALGIIGMQEGAELCGGRLRFFTKPGKGTIATLRMPKKSLS